MTGDPLELETDHRLPTGPWTGFYLENHNPRRGWMHLFLRFQDSVIEGEGTDYVGPWHLRGRYDLTTCQIDWVKSYLGKHQVRYDGTIAENGIRGHWYILDWPPGPFHIWPHNQTDLTELYMQDDLELPPTIQLGTVPIDSRLV